MVNHFKVLVARSLIRGGLYKGDLEMVNHFKVLVEMIERNLDIKSAGLENICEIETKEKDKAGFVTFGIPKSVATQLAIHPEKFVGCFVIADREQFLEIESILDQPKEV